MLLAMSVSAFNVSAEDMVTEWRTFPSANWRVSTNSNKVIQFCPTDRFVYVVMHGSHYSKEARADNVGYDYGYYAHAYPHLFIYDKENPDRGFRSHLELYPESMGVNVIAIGYNEAKKYLVVTYQDGLIEFLHEDGRIDRIQEFKDAKVPGSKEFNSVSFDSAHGDIYIGTQNGYLVVDEDTATLKEWVKLWSPVHYVNRLGDTLVAILDVDIPNPGDEQNPTTVETTIATFDLSKGNPTQLYDMVPLKLTNPEGLVAGMYNSATGHILASEGICPVTDNTFVTLGRKGTKTNSLSLISLTRLEDGTYRPLSLADQDITAVSANFTYKTPMPGKVNRMKDGWSFKLFDFQLVKEGIDPDFTAANPATDYAAKVVTRVRPTGLGFVSGGTYDGQDFWAFATCGASDINGGFRRYARDGQNTAALAEGQMFPHGPMSLCGRNISYAPGYGMIVPGREFDLNFMISYDVIDQLSVFDGEEWTPYGLPTISPSLTTMWKGARGSAVDPYEPKYFYSGSYASGILRRNLEDPTDILHISTGSNYSASRATDVQIIPGSTVHTNAHFTRPTFDADGRMWVSSYYSKDGAHKPVYYWEKEDRLASTDKNSYRPMKSFDIEAGGDNKASFVALAHPKNKNRLIFADGVFNSNLHVIDHGGTLDDTSDDINVSKANGVDENGRDILWNYIYYTEEDPVDGRVWIFSSEGLYWIDTDEFIANPGRMHRLVVKRVNGHDEESIVSESSQPVGYAVDSYNRKWFGINGGGIICVSPDNNEVLATFDTTNSELLSDIVFGLGWNPERNSLLISTDNGHQEMTILEGAVGSKTAPKVYPASIAPGYRGHVSIIAADDSRSYAICDADGVTVTELGQPAAGKLQWDLNDADGKRVPAGTYHFIDLSDNLKLGQIVVVE